MLKCPKQSQKVHLSFSKTRDDIEMKSAKYCEVTSKVPIFINKQTGSPNKKDNYRKVKLPARQNGS